MASRGSGSGELAGLSTPPQLVPDSTSAIEDDPSDLLGRLHLAIPDLELLLRRYKETHGELNLREALVRKKEAETLEIIKRKEEHIDRLMNQFHDAEKKHSKEYNKLRLHIGNLEENLKDLEERLHISETKRQEEAAINKELTEQKAALVRERMVIAKAAADERDKIVAEFEASKNDTEKQLDAARIRIAELTTQKDEIESKANAAKAEFESQTNALKAEIEAEAEKIKAELEAKAAASQELADNALKELESVKAELAAEKAANIDGWAEKTAKLTSEFEAEKQALITAHEETIAALKKAHKDDLNEQTIAFVGLQESLNLKMTTENQNLIEEIANLKKAWEEDKAKFEKMIEELKGVAQGIEEEKGRLEKIVDQFKEETDVKSKGDLHYIEAFRQLLDLIFGLSSSHFDRPPRDLSPDLLSTVPAHLPSLIEDTDESRQARSAFIAHIISSKLVERVFTPFLFGLGRRQEETEQLLDIISGKLRTKSSRNESTWRQHTLLAAYTTTHAKLQMNKEAGRVIDDIIAAILPFAIDTETTVTAVRAGVRKIVKLAVETWRYARLEREMIEAILPPVDEGENAEGEEGSWLPYGSQECEDGKDKTPRGRILLRVFPVIRREKVQEGFRLTEKDFNDQGCIYSRGWALYAA
ncbi:uncharacterized protein PV09_01448 [Verruconis gallopava]|uniref:Uncharacterized protein n=1 Tax=Verruconis gallopava TaxID=253628 RepID=A0A0D1XXK1_9PEZI|nr:uncharacterized protein PV09_01448 [Verruconis gallopava]KIW07481.1 hypothetical protein PV09_01448 [Verruconis gallopava]